MKYLKYLFFHLTISENVIYTRDSKLYSLVQSSVLHDLSEMMIAAQKTFIVIINVEGFYCLMWKLLYHPNTITRVNFK